VSTNTSEIPRGALAQCSIPYSARHASALPARARLTAARLALADKFTGDVLRDSELQPSMLDMDISTPLGCVPARRTPLGAPRRSQQRCC
jgi:hypothetical protein